MLGPGRRFHYVDSLSLERQLNLLNDRSLLYKLRRVSLHTTQEVKKTRPKRGYRATENGVSAARKRVAGLALQEMAMDQRNKTAI